jgi:tetratricopeptide (TPR) repeat protein
MRRETEPEGKSYYYGLVDEYLESGQTGRALIQAAKNIAYNEDDPVAYINRARVYEKLGAAENAILDLREAIRLSPDNRDAHALLERIRQSAGSR